jgi:hypothetical protein
MKRFFIVATCAVLLFACSDEKKDEPKTTESTTTAEADKDKKPQQSEFADPKYAEWGKKMTAQMASGDVDGWMSNYADKAMYRWSSGDSLAGKAAIAKYWTDRRKNVIDSISFTNEIWLPLKVNTPQAGPDIPGVWLISWYQVNVKYKNGKKLSFWTHTDHHYDANDKIDITIQYIDMAPIKAALGAK